MPKISISYRRADSEAMTGRIFDRLTAHYGKDVIFRDIDDIPPGIDFRHHINETLLKTNILLAVIGPKWLGSSRGGLERIQEESDPVRVEVETALRRRVQIIPVLIGNTRMPSSDQLPPSLKDFAFRNAVKVDTGQDFDYHMDRLIRSMDAILSQTKSSPPSRETKMPTGSAAKASTGANQAVDASAETPRKKDTGGRAAATDTGSRAAARDTGSQAAAEAPAADPGKEAAPFSFLPAIPPAWHNTLWPESRQARILRLAIGGGIAAFLLLLSIVVTVSNSGGERGQRLFTLSGHLGPVISVAYSPNARMIASGSFDKSIKVWDAGNGQLLRTLTGDADAVSSLAFSPDGKWLASGSLDRTIFIWDAATGKSIRGLRYDQTYSWEVPPSVWSIAISSDSTKIASGSADSTVRIWNEATGELLRVLKGHTDVVTSVAYLPNGKTIVSGSKDGTVRLWDADSAQVVRTLTGHAGQVLSIAVSPDGKKIAAGGSGNAVIIWNAANGQELRTLNSESNPVDALAFSIDGEAIAIGGTNSAIEVWDADAGQSLRKLPGHTGSIRALAFSSDGHHLASGSDDKTVGVWSAN